MGSRLLIDLEFLPQTSENKGNYLYFYKVADFSHWDYICCQKTTSTLANLTVLSIRFWINK
jgi:hypothetical protein